VTRVPLTVWGWREMTLATLVAVVAGVPAWVGAVRGHAWCWPIAVGLTLIWAWVISFFRDPQRAVPADPDALVAPADGRLTEVTRLADDPLVGGAATRFGIFLSIFNVHVNRSPCDGVVESIRYEPGSFLDARHPESGARNEANTIVIATQDPAVPRIVVRQIAGRIARRIICDLKVGEPVTCGQRIGMIKFGSRTELIVPGHATFRAEAAVGDRVRGAATIMARRCPPDLGTGPQPAEQVTSGTEERA